MQTQATEQAEVRRRARSNMRCWEKTECQFCSRESKAASKFMESPYTTVGANGERGDREKYVCVFPELVRSDPYVHDPGSDPQASSWRRDNSRRERAFVD